jgi:1-acyl-sn-glycerol-3-phosphate acyltransferase
MLSVSLVFFMFHYVFIPVEIAFIILSLPMLFLSSKLLPIQYHYMLQSKMLTVFNALVLLSFNIQLYVQQPGNKKRASSKKPTVLFFTHASNLDATVTACSISYIQPGYVYTGLGKMEILRVPIMGWFMYLGGIIGIERADRGKAIDTLKGVANMVVGGEKGIGRKVVAISPEGTRRRSASVGFEHLLPFKKGPFHMLKDVAEKSKDDLRVIVCCIAGSRSAWPGILARSGSVVCTRFADIELRSEFVMKSSVDELSEHIRKVFEKEMNKMIKEGSNKWSGLEASRSYKEDTVKVSCMKLLLDNIWPLAVFYVGILGVRALYIG